MFGNYFYHQKIRKLVTVFGALFNDIYVKHTNADGETISQVKVPLAYGPKQKFIERIKQVEGVDEQDRLDKVAIRLPRMSFEMLNFTFDAQRQLPRNNTVGIVQENNTTKKIKFSSPIPYVFDFQLSIFAKNQDEVLQIVEQIIPYFNPVYTVTIKPFKEYPNVKEDIPVVLDSITFEDTYEQPLQLRRTIVYSLAFEMRSQFYGPLEEQSVVNNTIIEFLDSDADTTLSKLRLLSNDINTNPCDPTFDFTTEIYIPTDPNSDSSF